MTRCCANTGKTKVASHEPVPVLLADAVAGLCRLGARDGGAMSPILCPRHGTEVGGDQCRACYDEHAALTRFDYEEERLMEERGLTK